MQQYNKTDGVSKKIAAGCQASIIFDTAGGDLRYWLCF
jgi:hypothetical protein